MRAAANRSRRAAAPTVAAVRMAAGLAAVAALAAFAPDAAAHVGAPDWHHRLYNPHMLDQPRIISRPASGDTYYPGETITVYVPWGRTQTRTSISVNSVGTVQLVLTVGENSHRTITGVWEDRSARYGPAFTIRRLYFDYVVRAGDRDTNGVALAQNALSSPGNAESGIRGTAGSSFRQFELEKALHGFGDQSGHKVDTPAPSFAGVSSPSLILYRCGSFDDCGSASHRLPTLSNAAQAHRVRYSMAPERPLPSGLVLDAATATITGSHSGVSARQSYTLRATDGFGRTADLTFNLEVRDDVGIESITVTSNPGSDRTYGKNGDFGTNDTITARVDFSRNIGSIIRSNICLNIRIGGNTRRVCNPTGATRQDKLDFSYAVVESDWDGDGISFPANPMGAGKSGYLRFYRAGIGGGDNRIDRSFGAVLDDPNHKVRGRQTMPSFGATASPAWSWVKDNAVSQVLPAATGGDGGLTYSVEEGLPDGLVFTAATRTLSGTPTAVQGATNYTLVATDGDGDKAELRFSIEVEEIAVSISSPSVSEGAAGETAALPFAVTLNRAPGRQVTVDWAADADPGTAASGADYTAFSGGALTFAAADTSKTVEVTVTGDARDEPDETIRIALSNPSGAVLGSAATGVGTITDDDPTPTLALSLSDPDAGRPDTIRESGAGNATTVTASLGGGISGEAITVTVSAASTYAALAADGGFTLSAARTLTIAAGAAASAGAVTIAATDDTIDSRDKTATVSGAVAGGHGLVAAPAALTLTIADEDSRPSSALALAPASVSESGGVATVTATLSHPSAEAATIAVSATASTGAVDGDFTLSTANTLTVAAGRTTSAGVVTVTAVGNPTSSPDKEVTVKGSASGSPGAADPPDATLTLRDDDGPPTVSLVLSSSSVSESGGVATVTASLNGGTSGEAVTVTVSASAVAVSGAVAGDFGLSGGTTLTIAANATASTGTVTITASDNDVDAPDKRVTVSGTAAGGNGVADPASATLTLADDEALPTAALALAPASIAEAGGLSTVTATLSGESSAATTLTVTAAAGANAAAGDFTLSAAATLTIAAGETASAGTVTVAAVADTTDSPDKLVTVGAAAAGGNGIADPAAATLTVTDDDALPTLTLTLSPSTIDESGAGSTATVTAALSHPSSEAVTVTVSAVAVSPADSGDFSVSAADTLTIAAGATTSAGAVTVAAVDDRTDAPDKRVTVSGAASGGRGAANPPDATLTIADDDDPPGVTLSLSPASISENGGTAEVGAVLSRTSSAATTISVAAATGFYGIVTRRFSLNGIPIQAPDRWIVIAAGRTTSADTAAIAAVDDDVHQGSAGRSVTVTATMINDQGTAAVTGAALALSDDETLPTATLALSSSSIPESGGVTTVTAALSGASSEAVTVTVSAAPGADAAGGDFTLSAAATLTIAAGETASSGTVTVTANPNTVDSPDKTVTISGAADGGNGVADPAAATLTITDDDMLPTLTLKLSPASISEDGGVATVTAALSHPSSAAVTLTAAASAVSPAVAGDFTLSAATALTIAAGATVSTGQVTVTAADNDVDAPDKRVRVSAAAVGGRGVADPAAATLTITDDETTPTITLSLSPMSISEARGVATVTAELSGESSEAVTVTVSAAPASGVALTDFSLSAARTLTIAAGATASTGRVTVTGVNDDERQAAAKQVTISGAAAGGNGVSAPADVTLTITDNDSPPSQTQWRRPYPTPVSDGDGWDVTTQPLLGKTRPQPISIALGTKTGNRRYAEAYACVTRTVRGPRQIRSEPWSPASPWPGPPDSSICTRLAPKGTMPSSISLTQAMIDNDGVVIVIYGSTHSNPVRGLDYYAEWVPITPLPKAALALAPSSISENGGVSTVTATLDKEAVSASTLTVSAAPSPPTVAGDFTLSAAAILTFAAGETTSAGAVTVTGVDNPVDAPDKRVTVRAAASEDVRAPPLTTLTITDDDDPPTAALAVSPASIAESGGAATVTATLSHPSSEPSTVTVTALPGSYTVGSDAVIVIAAGSTTNATDTATVVAVDNDVDEPARTPTVTAALANGQGAGAVTGATLMLTDDDAAPTVALSVTPSSVSENGGAATVTAALSRPSSEPTTVTVTAAMGAAYRVGSDATIVIAAGATANPSDTATVSGVDNAVDAADNAVTVTGSAANGQGVGTVTGAALTLADDDTAGVAVSPATSATNRLRTTESGGTATFTVRLESEPTGDVELDVASTDTDEGTAAPAVLTFTASDWSTAQTVTLTGVDDSPPVADGSRSYTVTLTVDRTNTADAKYDALSGLTVYAANADNEFGLDVGSVSGQATESGGTATFTVALRTRPAEAVTVAVTSRDEGEGLVSAGGGAPAASTTLVFAPSAWNAAQTVTVTGVQDPVDDGTAAWNVRLDPSSGDTDYDGLANVDVSVSTTDDDGPPTVTLALNPASIAESGTGNAATVTARLSHPSGAATTVTVTAVAGVWTVGAGADATIVVAAGDTTSTDTAMVTAVDNPTDEPDRTPTVTGTAANDRAAADGATMTVTGATLTITDDDPAPTVTLALNPSSVSENGGVSTVTATLSHPSSEPSTVTVAAVSGAWTVGTDATITIAAGATTAASDTVLVTAVDDAVHQGSAGRTATVTAALANGQGAGSVTGAALTLTDDETLPTVALALSSTSITETGGVSTVTARLSGPSSAAVTVTVAAAAGAGAVSGDFDLSSATTLTIAAGATTSAGTVTVTANGNTVDSPNKSVTVSGTAAGGYGVANPPDATLTLEDDDDLPTVALVLTPPSITETGGISTVTATLSGPSSEAVTVTVAAAVGTGAAAADFDLSSATTLTIAAGATVSAGTVTVTANGNTVDAPDKSVTVSGTAAGGNNVVDPPNVTLTLEDDDDLPTVSLVLSDSSITETGGISTVTARLSGPSSEAVTVTVAAAAVGSTGAVSGDFDLSSARTLTIAAGTTVSAGTVTVTANGNTVDAPDKSVTVSGTAAGGNDVADPPDVTLTLEDDDDLPTAALVLTPSSITETGGVSTVTATLSGVSSEAVTVTVGATAGTGAVAADFALSTAKTLTIAAGSTVSAGLVTVTANGNVVHSPNKSVTVSGTAAGGNGVADPPDATLTLEEDDALPTVALVLSSTSITETGGVSTVTATLSGVSSEAVTVTVGAGAGTGAVAADFALSAAKTLTIAAGSTTSTGTVTVTANGNAVHSPNKSVTVSGTAAGGNSVANPPNATLTLEDDDDLPTAALALSSTSISENGGVSTVTATLSGPSSAAVTVTVAAAAVASTGAVAGDFTLSSTAKLTIAAGDTTSAGLVTVTANDNTADEPDAQVRVSATAAGGNGVTAPPAVTLTIRDDEGPPTVTLVLTPSTIDESGTGSTAAVTATLNRASSAATTVTVSVAPVASTGAAAGDYALSSAATLTIPVGATTSSGTVTVAAMDDDTDAPNKQVTVSGTAVNDQGVQQPIARTLTIADDDAAPDAALALSASSISENGGVSTVTATLSRVSVQATTVTVQSVSGAFTVGSGAASRIVIAAGATVSADEVALTAVDNDVDAADRQVTVTAALTNGHGAGTVTGGGVALTLADDDTAGIAVSPSTSTTNRLVTTESGGTATFTVALESEPTGNVELDVASSDTDEGTAAPAVLTFTSSTWSTAQTVTVTGADDSPPAADGSQDYTVTVTVDTANTVDSNYDALSALTVYAVNADNEYGLDVGSVSGQATEAGGTSTFTVALRTQPTEAVTVSVTSRDTGEGLVSVGGGAPAASTPLTFAAAAWNTAQTVTVTGVDDNVDDGTVAWDVRLDPSSGDGNYEGLSDVDVSVSTTDDDGPPGVTLALNPASIAESGSGNVATVTARLSHASGAATTVTVTAVSGAWTVGAGADATIVVAAGDTTSTDTAMVTAVDNATDEPARTPTVTGTVANDRAAADSTTMTVTGATLTITDDDPAPTAALSLDPSSVSENGGVSTVTATLSHPSSQPSTVTVSAVSGLYTVDTDATITIAAGSTTAASDTVLVTAVDDDVHQGSAGRSVTVTAALTNGQGAGAVTGAALTLTDDETLPTVALALSSTSISETGGVSTVTATLSGPSSEAVTVTVAAAAGTGAVAADFDLSSATTLTFAAGSTTSAGTVTVTANGNAVDSPNKSVTVSGTAAGGNGVVNPPNVTLTLTDDETLPTVALALSASSISETGGVSTVTATLSGPSSAAVTVTVAAAAGAGAVAADFALSTAATLTFAANATTSTGLVTVTANGNTVDSPNKSVIVSGAAAGGNGVANPPNVTLTLTDDDDLPTVVLALSDTSISETGGISTVTATLSGPSSAAVTVTVAAAAGTGAVAADFTLSTAATLTFAANATTSTGLVTVTANGNDVDSPNKSVTVSGAAAGGNGVVNPPNVTLTLEDDDALPTVALAFSDTSISETGGISTVTATLSGKSSAAVTVTVAAAAGVGAVAGDFTQSGTTLTIAAGATTSAGEVTVTANGNTVHSPNKSVTVSGAATGGNGVSNPPNVTLTLTDDETLPTVSLALTPSSISETGGVSTVTATLSGPSSAAVTVTVAAGAGAGAVAADFTLSSAATLTIAAGSTESAGLVTVTANGNDVDSPNKSVTVSGTSAGGNGVANPPNVTLTLTDDEALPTVALVLTPATVGENGGVSTVTATLSGKSSAAVTLTVSAAAVASTGAVAGDFALSSATTLTIAAGATVSTGTVTVTAQDNSADEPDVEVRVTATAAGGNGAAAPPAATLTIRDDEGPPTVTLVLTPSTIDESGTGSTAAVTATLNRASSAATTVTVSVAPVASTGAAAGDYTLSSAATLTIAAGATTSSGTVTVAAVDNDTDAPNRQATVSGTAVNDQGVQQPIARTLTITDDDAAPDATLALSATSISENGGTATVTATLSRRSAQATTVTVQAVTGAYSVGLGAAARIVLAAGATSSTDGVALTAVDNDVDAADRQVTVTAVLTNGHGAGTVSGGGVSLTLTDDDTAGIAVSPATSTGSRLETTESAGTATFTVKLATEPTGNVEIGTASSDTSEGTVGPSSLTFTASDWSTAQTVTLTGVDDAAADGSRDYTVTLTIDQTNTADSNYDALSAVTVYARNRDNEFGLNVSAVSGQATEAGGQATFTVALRTQPTAAVTVSVSSRDAGEGTASPPSLIFTTGGWSTAQTVTVTGANDSIDDGTVTWTVRLDPASGDGDYDTSSVEEDVSVTTTDDDGPPGVTLALNPSSIAESGTGNAATVTARLSHASGAATTVTVTAVSGFYAPGTDAAIVIAAGATQAASDTATVVAVDNDTDAPDRTETVTASITNARATADSTTMAVTGAALTVRDDDAAPGATLSLNPSSVSENGGVSTVTATLSRPSSQPSTVTVTAVSGSYTVGTDATITIAAGATTAASDTVLVTAVDDGVHQGSAGRSATVTAALANGQGAGSVTGAALTLTDDETLPVASLVLTPASISEEGGVSAVTATLSGASSESVTVTVAAAAGTGAVAADFDLSTAMTLTIVAGSTTSTGAVTVRANGNAVASGNKQVVVSGTSAGGNGVANPANATLTLADDDTPQTRLALSSSSISENGGVATVTATLDRQSAAAVTVTVAAAAGANTAAGDFTLSTATTLTFAANATTSTGLVTVTAVNDTTDAPDKSVTVSGTAADSLNLTNDPSSVTLTIPDDEAAPGVVLSLNPGSVSENGGASAVSATLSHPSSEPSTVTVTAVSGAYTVGAGAAGTIVIAAGSTTAASDTAAVTAVNDGVHQGTAGRSVTVTATLANGQGAGSVTGAALTLTDDETLPTASLHLTPTSISENGGVSTVAARLSGPSSQPVTVTVSSSAVASTGAVAGDFTQTGTTLTIAAGSTTSAGTVTVRGNDNAVDAANKQVAVSGTSAGGNGVSNPSAATLTLTDDEATATATLVLTPRVILENGAVSTVTARLSHPTTEATTLTVSAAPVAPAVAGDFTQSATNTLTIAAGGTTSTGTVTVTAVNNEVVSGRKRVTVSATVTGGRGVAAPSAATLTIRDDEFGLDESAVTGQATEGGGTATFTVALQTQPSAAVTVSVTSRDGDGRPDESEGTVSPPSLVFTPQNWSTAQRVTVTGVDDDVDDGDVAWKVRLDPSSGDADYDSLAPVDVDVTTTDDDDAPTVTLDLDPASISEAREVSTVTATLSRPSSAETTVTVSVAPVSPAVEGDFSLSPADTLTIAAGGTTSTGLVTVTAVNNDVDAPDKTVTVSGTAQNGMGVGVVSSVTLTLTDDDEKGLAFSSAALVVAAGSSTTWTVELTSEPTGDVTVAISSPDDAAGLTVDPARLTFTASDWDTAQTVTATAAAGAPGDAGGAASALRHTGSGGGYGGVEKALWVAGEEAAEIGTSGDTGTMTTSTYVMNGQPVTVMKAAGVPAGVTIRPLRPPTRPVTVTVTRLSDAEAAEAAGSGYGLGPAGSRVALDVSVSPALGAGRLCLPVDGDLREAAAGREVFVLRGGKALVGSEQERGPDGRVFRVCAEVPSFSPFALGYPDSAPSFTAASLTLTFTVGEEQAQTLPAAEGGDGVVYLLTPEDEPPGLSVDLGTRVLSGTPTEVVTRSYAWTARDVDGPQQDAKLELTIEVRSNVKEARARLAAINRSILPEVSRASWSSAMDALSRRLGSSAGGGGSGSGASGGGLSGALAGFLQSNEPALEEGGASWKELWSGQSFAAGLGGGGEGESGGGGRSVTVWGSGEHRSLSREAPSLEWSGHLFAAHLGADAGFGSGLTGGLGVSWFESELEYTDRGGEEAVAGVHRSRMASVQPYVGWSSGSGSRLWGALGYGAGEVEIVDEALRERFGRQESGSGLLAVAAGGAWRVSPVGGAVRLDLKGEAQATRYEVEDNGDLIEGLSVRTKRLRVSAEGTRGYYVSSGGGRVWPSAEVGIRWDGGDGATGAGVEVGGGVSWSDAGGRLTLEARGRALAAHRSDLDEWGITGGMRLSPRGNGRGLSLSVEPVWGSAGSGTARLWEEGMAGSRSPSGGRSGGTGLDAELGYGVGVFGGFGVGTPYLRYGQAPEGERRYGLGWRLAARPAGAFDLDLEAWRRERDTDRPGHGLRLELRLSW